MSDDAPSGADYWRSIQRRGRELGAYDRGMLDDDEGRVILRWDGVQIDLTHVEPHVRNPMIAAARVWMAKGQRPPMLTVYRDGVDVSTRPELWPARVRDYRGLGRLEWVGDDL